MKKFFLTLIAMVCCMSVFAALPHAFYVKKGNTTTKYNFGVASDLKFSNGGKTLTVTGYNESINLDDIDYITFSPELDNLALTPTAQKARMLQIGKDAYAYVHMQRVAELLRMIDVFFNAYYDNYDNEHKHPFEYNIPEEYINKHSLKKMLKGFAGANNNNPAGIRAFRNAALDIYKASDYFGVYTANPETETWEKTKEADYFEILFQSEESGSQPKYYSARLDCSDDFTTWSGERISIEVPKTITFTCSYNGTELGKAVIETIVEPNADMAMTVTSDVSGYHVVNRLNIQPDKITDIVDVTIDGKYYMHVDTDIDGQDLTDYDQMYRDIRDANGYEIYEDGRYDWVEGNAAALAAHFKRANVSLDVLKELQVKGKMFNFSLLNERFSVDKYRDGYYGSTTAKWNKETGILDIDYYDNDVIQSHVDYLLDYSDIQFFYDGNPNIQGFISWDINDEIDWEYTPHHSENSGYYMLDDNHVIWAKYKSWSEEDYEKGVEYWGYYDSNDNVIPIDIDGDDVIRPSLIREHYKEIMPVVIFPDLSSFSFYDFFTANDFQSLIDDYEEIISTYKAIVGIEDDEDDY